MAINRKTSRSQAPMDNQPDHKPDSKPDDNQHDSVDNEPIANRGVRGEGNYQASREYNEATRQFVKSGRVADAARDAAPKSADDSAAS